MAVPNTMQDLSTLASSNSPAGSEAIGNSLDNYLRAYAAIVRSTYALASSTIAAASTTDIGLADAESVQITGAATITSFGTGFNGCRRELRFSGACTLVASGNVVLPGGANVVTAAGDVITLRCTGAGIWTLTGRAKPAIASSDVTGALGYTPVNRAGDTMTGNLNVATGTALSSVNVQTINGMNVSLSAVDGFGNGFIGTTSNHNLGIYTNNAKVADFLVGGGLNLSGTYRSNGANAGFFQQSRNLSSQVWANYAFDNVWRLDIEGVGGPLLAVSSSGSVSASGGFDFGSSRKLKNIDGPLPYGLSEVERVVTLIGRYKPEYNNDGRTRLFFDAEQLAEVMPETVDSEGVEFEGKRVPSVKLDQLLPPAYRAIAELAERVRDLDSLVSELKAAH